MDAPRDYLERNRRAWNRRAGDYVKTGEGNWAASEPSWGRWSVPESALGVLPRQPDGLDCIELGCGTAYVSAWLARRGARPVGIDQSEEQLATAARLQAEHELSFPLLHANAEQVPLADASFDLAISEYGASIWCDPYRWIPEAARLILLLCAAQFGFWYGLHAFFDTADWSAAVRRYETWDSINHDNPERRIFVNQQLNRVPGKLLVLVRYSPRHIFQDEWVYNRAAIDESRIVWARDLGDAENQPLLRYYPDRTALLLEPDAQPPRLTPYQPPPVPTIPSPPRAPKNKSPFEEVPQ